MLEKYFCLVILSFILFMGPNELADATGYHYSSSEVNLDELKVGSDFKVLTPPHGKYRLEVKEPRTHLHSQLVSRIKLHYFDISGQKYLFGLEEHKAHGYIYSREKIGINIRNKSIETKKVVEEFKFDLSGEKIKLNGFEARFIPWKNHYPGGYLRWIQDGTYLDMDSGVLTKEEMIQIAKSIN